MMRIAFSLVAPLAMCMLGVLGGCKEGPKKSDAPGQTPATPAATPAKAAGGAAKGGGLIDQPTQTKETTPPGKPGAGSAAAAGGPGSSDPAPAAATGEPASTGIPECDSYIKRLLDCKDYPPQGKDVVRASIDVWKKTGESGGDAAKAAADDCRKSEQQSDQSLKGIGC